MELKDYWQIIRNRWIGVLLFVIVGAVAALGYSLTQPDVYAATSTGFVSAGKGGDAGVESLGDTLAKSRAKSYLVLATDRDTAQLVADDLGTNQSPAALASRISVSQPPDTVLLEITAKGGTPQEAQRLADAWVVGLAERVQQIENRDAGKTASTMSIETSSSAALPSAPVSPKPLRNAVLGAIVGAMLGFGYAVARHQLDRRIRTEQQVEKLGVHVVGSLPEISGQKDTDLSIMATGRDQVRSVQAAEGFRKLRTNLSYMDVDNPPRIIVVTSPNQGDGKSSVALNLAAVMAVGGQRVTLIDGDLRRPRVANALELSDDIGLTDVLTDRVQLSDAVQPHDEIANLHVLAAGNRPPNPSELLGSLAMQKTLQALAVEGMVIIDAPPLLPVTDAAVLSRAGDGALVVVSTGKTLDVQLQTALDNLARVQGRVLGVVLNRVTRRRSTSQYYDQHYSYVYEQSAKPARAHRGRRKARA